MPRGGASAAHRAKGDQQRDRLLSQLREYIGAHGYAPSIREMMVTMGYRSPSPVQYHLNILRQQGRIAYRSDAGRTITIVEG